MHVPVRFLILPSLMAPIYAQNSTPPVPVQVRSLTIHSASLPEADRQRIVHALQGGTYLPEELEERLRQYLRDSGYYNARVEHPQLSAIKKAQDARSADFIAEVNPGPMYALGEITFENTRVFAPNQLRSQFPSKTGDPFDATDIGKGLENLRNLYGSKGYANFAAIPKPQIDEARHIIRLVVDIDEGRPVSFGGLRLEGIEPVSGAGRSLLDSWENMQARQYNPVALKTWLASETAGWPHEAAAQVYTEYLPGSNPDAAIDVLLHFQ